MSKIQVFSRPPRVPTYQKIVQLTLVGGTLPSWNYPPFAKSSIHPWVQCECQVLGWVKCRRLVLAVGVVGCQVLDEFPFPSLKLYFEEPQLRLLSSS